ncbi:MAG: hypothetical protein I8H66_02655 [Sphingobacteriia bacterium]|nr:hypothetical protein [Sphingobacteriia bacterium]
MEINRHNYETYFLLWVDGELSVAQQEAVALFVAENPDLAEELALLQDAKLPADEQLIFPDKASLLKQESAGISLNNYTEYFMLYVDGELSSAAQQQTELFVLQHPQLQPGFLLFQQAKLPLEKIAFPDKSVLYRKEQKERPVVFMMWRRVAIAAVLTGLAFSVWMLVPEDAVQKTSAPLAANAPVMPAGKPSAVNNNSSVSLNNGTIEQSPEVVILQQEIKRNTIVIPAVEKSDAVTEPVPDNSRLMAASGEMTLPANQAAERIETVNAANLQAETNTAALSDGEEKQNMFNQVQEADNDRADLIKPTVYKELDTDDNSKSLYVGTMEINRDKLRGFLRKAGTIFRSKSRQEDDKIDTNK